MQIILTQGIPAQFFYAQGNFLTSRESLGNFFHAQGIPGQCAGFPCIIFLHAGNLCKKKLSASVSLHNFLHAGNPCTIFYAQGIPAQKEVKKLQLF